MCVIYRFGGCAHLAIRVCRALEAGLGDQALEIGRELLLEPVHTRALRGARSSRECKAVGRTLVCYTCPAPGAGRAQGARGVLGPYVSRIAIARVPARTLRRGDRIVGAIGGSKTSRAKRVGRTLLAGGWDAIVSRHAGAIISRV